MIYDPIASGFLIVFVVLGIVAVRRGRRDHLGWIVPFALVSLVCIPWRADTGKLTSSGNLTFNMTLVIPGSEIIIPICIFYGLITLLIKFLIMINDRKSASQLQMPPEEVWPPAPSSKPPTGNPR